MLNNKVEKKIDNFKDLMQSYIIKSSFNKKVIERLIQIILSYNRKKLSDDNYTLETISNVQVLINVSIFLFLYFLTFIILLTKFLYPFRIINRNFNLFYGFSFPYKVKNYNNFLNNAFNLDGYNLFNNKLFHFNKYIFFKEPLIPAFLISKASYKELIYIVFFHFCSFFYFLKLITKNRIFSYLYKDYSFYSIGMFLSQEKSIKNIFYNNTSCASQYFFLRNEKFNTIFFPYSFNFVDPLFNDNHNYTDPLAKRIFAQHAILPDKSFVKLFSEYKFINNFSFNKNLFLKYFSQPKSNLLSKYNLNINEKKIISIFDVAPYKRKNLRSIYYNKTGGIYNSNYIIKFYKDLLKFYSRKDFVFILKVKRNILNDDIYDERYLKFIESLNRKPNIILVDNDINLVDLIKSSYAIIGVPFTTPVLIASLFNSNTYFYNPLKKIIFSDFLPINCRMINGFHNLKIKIGIL